MNKYHLVSKILVLALLSQVVYAQEQQLNLFQATDNNEDRQANNRRAQRNTPQNTEPAFTLVGTSRFGDRYHASLKSREGESVQVEWTEGIVREIEGHRGYAIADIGSRSVAIRVPDADSCITNVDKGVRCNGNVAVLTLSNVKPLPPSQQTNSAGNRGGQGASGDNVNDNQGNGENGDEPLTIGNTNVLTRNPFSGELQDARDFTPEELAARQERQQRRAEQFRNFEIVRIPDNEIPEGMQRIRTPFGDRLEPAGSED